MLTKKLISFFSSPPSVAMFQQSVVIAKAVAQGAGGLAQINAIFCWRAVCYFIDYAVILVRLLR